MGKSSGASASKATVGRPKGVTVGRPAGGNFTFGVNAGAKGSGSNSGIKAGKGTAYSNRGMLTASPTGGAARVGRAKKK